MKLLRKFRFSMAMVMMLVLTAAVASALFVKIHQHVDSTNVPYLKIDAPVLFLLAVVLTAVALGSLKAHSAGQILLQITLACLSYLSLISLAELKVERPLFYWFQVNFALLVTLPLVARRFVKTEMERGPKRTLWKNRCEAIFFAFLTMGLVLVGLLFQWLGLVIGEQGLKF